MLASESSVYALMLSAELSYSMRAPGASKGRSIFLREFLEKKLRSGHMDAATAALLRKRFMSVRRSAFLPVWENYYRRLDQTATFLKEIAHLTDMQRLEAVVSTFEGGQGPLTSLFGGAEYSLFEADKERFDNYGLLAIPQACKAGFSGGWITTHIDTAFVGRNREHMYTVIASLQRYGFLVLSDENRRFHIDPKPNLLRLKSAASNPLGPAAVASAQQELLHVA